MNDSPRPEFEDGPPEPESTDPGADIGSPDLSPDQVDVSDIPDTPDYVERDLDEQPEGSHELSDEDTAEDEEPVE